LNAQVDKRRDELNVIIGRTVLIDAFEKTVPEDIAAILERPDIKPLIKDDILLRV